MPFCDELIAAVSQGCNYETASGVRRENGQSVKRQISLKGAYDLMMSTLEF